MRHGDKIKNLSRTKSHRKALLKNLAISLFTHKAIVTTLAKAKALRVYVEPLITKTKGITTQELMTARQRFIFSHLQHEDATKELFTVIAPKVADRPGGYCRIIKLGRRKTDSSEMAYIELIDFNAVKFPAVSPIATEEAQEVTTSAEPKKRTRRSKSSTTKSEATEQATDTQVSSDAPVAGDEESSPATDETKS